MSLSTIESAVRNGLEAVVADATKAVSAVGPHLQELASLAAKAESSPLVQAALSVALGPQLEQQIANLILEFDKTVNVVAPAPAAPAPPVAPVG